MVMMMLNFTGALLWAVMVIVFFASGLSAGDKRKSGAKQTKTYGAKSVIMTEPLTISEAAKTENVGKTVRLRATVDEVCQSMGCWLIVKEGDITMRIKTKDHAFYVPKNIAGRIVIVEGVVLEQIIEESLARHYAEDAGKSEAEIEAITGEQRELSLIASSITVLPK